MQHPRRSRQSATTCDCLPPASAACSELHNGVQKKCTLQCRKRQVFGAGQSSSASFARRTGSPGRCSPPTSWRMRLEGSCAWCWGSTPAPSAERLTIRLTPGSTAPWLQKATATFPKMSRDALETSAHLSPPGGLSSISSGHLGAAQWSKRRTLRMEGPSKAGLTPWQTFIEKDLHLMAVPYFYLGISWL